MTTSLYTPIPDCRICFSTNLIPVLDLGMQALTGVFPKSESEDVPAGPLAVVKCSQCGLVQLAHNYDLSKLYGETYGYRSGLNQSMVRHLRDKVTKIESFQNLVAGDLVIDIGSNDGTTLASYTTPNLRRIGMDPSGAKFRHYYPEGSELLVTFFSADAIRQVAGSKKAKVITSIAMFYDLERPLDFVNQIVEVLADDGIWVFEQSYLPTMIATSSYDTVCHEHLEYYTLKQIEYMMKQVGLKIVDVELNDINGGSFSVTAAHRSHSATESPAVARFLADEVAAGYDTVQPFETLRSNMARHRDQVRGFLTNAATEGRKVLGYGASTKGNVLLQYCGIDRSLLPCIAEVNEDKFGAFTPGTKIPILSEVDARMMRPEYFMVLPWHFRNGIVAKEHKHLATGGKLVFPLPKLEIVTGDSAGASADN
jgi:C-methyltransferase C-terminal domain/Putative zinc binding domain/Methyltransferase domain